MKTHIFLIPMVAMILGAVMSITAEAEPFKPTYKSIQSDEFFINHRKLVSRANGIPMNTPIFRSGFEGTTAVVGDQKNQMVKIMGVDTKFPTPNDWVKDLEQNPSVGDVRIQFQGGTETQRHAKVIEDPTQPNNHVLHFSISDANVYYPTGGDAYKARTQLNIYNNNGIKEIHQFVRVYFPKDIETMRSYPKKTSWVTTLSEFWNNSAWKGQPYPFRISLNVTKPNEAVGSGLNFKVHGQVYNATSDKFTDVWEVANPSVTLPVGKWVTFEYYLKEGNGTNGRFMFAIITDERARQVVFDVTNFTHHPSDPAPDGFGDFNPLKLYTSAAVLNFLKERGKSLQVYWDDFELWE